MRFFLLALPLLACGQDTVRVTSPNGQIEMKLDVLLPPAPGSFLRLAYRIWYQGKPLTDDSYLGFLIHNQEPLLGQNLGLTASKSGHGEGFNWLMAEFLQNGSIGRRINVEVRAYDDAVAFRYSIPRTAALEDLVIESEETEFSFPRDVTLPIHADPPLRVEQPGLPSVELAEVPAPGFPKMRLERSDPRTMRVLLPAPKDGFPVSARSPLTTPWRVLSIGSPASSVTVRLK